LEGKTGFGIFKSLSAVAGYYFREACTQRLNIWKTLAGIVFYGNISCEWAAE